MRISDPKLFNGQTLATKQQISAWLAGTTTDNGFGTLSIPASNVKYGTNSNVSAQITAIYAKLGLDNDGEDVNVIQSITRLETNLTTVSGDLDVAEAAISTLTGTVKTPGSVKYDAKAAADSALKDAKDYTDALASGRVATAEGEIDAIQAKLAGLSQATVVEYVEGVSENLQDAIGAVGLGADIEITSEAGGDYAMVYTIKQGGSEVGTINIPKDQFLQSGEYIPSAEVLRLTFALPQGESNTVDIPVGALVDEYSGSSAITITDNVNGKNIISLKVAESEKYLTVTDKGLESKGIDDAIDAAVSDANAKLAGITDTVSAYVTDAISSKANTGDVTDINTRLTTAENTITTLTGGVEVSGSVKYEAADAAAKAVSDANAKLEGIETTVTAAITAAVSDKANTSTVNSIDTRLSGAESTLTGKAEQSDLEAVSGKLEGITGKVSDAIATAVADKADTDTVNDIAGRLTTAENTITTLTGSVEVSGSVKYEAAAAVSGANAKLEGIETVSGAIEAAKTAVISEVKLVEQTLTFTEGKATVTTAGRVLQVFDSTGVCWPDIKYSDAGIATINIGTDAESTTGYSAVIVKKTNIA